MEWLAIIGAAIGGLIGGALCRHYQIKNDFRYTWECPEAACVFHCATNQAKILEVVRLSHIHDHELRKGLEN